MQKYLDKLYTILCKYRSTEPYIKCQTVSSPACPYHCRDCLSNKIERSAIRDTNTMTSVRLAAEQPTTTYSYVAYMNTAF